MTLSDDKYVSLESVFCPGQYVVVDEDGEVQSPVETPATHRNSLFIPFPHSTATVSDVIVSRAIQIYLMWLSLYVSIATCMCVCGYFVRVSRAYSCVQCVCDVCLVTPH